ncbi:MAG: AzlC family ABC transporter permease [Candidatus Puniceispirillales bacterium]
MPETPPDPGQLAEARRDGMKAGLGIPGLSIFATMLGFAAIAREAGFDLPMTLTTTALVWGMPGQVAMATLHTAGASAFVIITAVALANMRMLLMTVSGMAIMGLTRDHVPFWEKLLLVQMLAITSWLQIGSLEGERPPRLIRSYFIGMAGMLYGLGMLGTAFGYYMDDWVNPHIMLAIMVITPLYILLMVINARRLMMRIAGVSGGVLCPLLYPLLGEWSILIGGVVGGTLVVMLWPQKRGSDG